MPGRSTLEAAIFYCGVMTAVASSLVAYWIVGPYGEREQDDPRVIRIEDPTTRRLRLLIYDVDGDGRLDTRSYMGGERVVSMEIDEDEDGWVDRREYYAPDGSLERTVLSHRQSRLVR